MAPVMLFICLLGVLQVPSSEDVTTKQLQQSRLPKRAQKAMALHIFWIPGAHDFVLGRKRLCSTRPGFS